VHFPCPLKLGDAAAVTLCSPSPPGAVKVNTQVDLAVVDWSCPVKAPATSTHLVSLLALTVSVRAPPCLAYSAPPEVKVPAPPVKTAPETLEAKAAGALSSPNAIANVATRASEPRPQMRPCRPNVVSRRCAKGGAGGGELRS
jgi:hypothetical protein